MTKDKDIKTALPILRFPEFRESGEWEVKTLGEISNRIEKKVGSESLTTVSISAGKGFVTQAEKFSRDISGQQYKNYIVLHKGEFAYNKGNSKKFPQGCIYKLKEFEKVAAPNAFICFQFKENYVSDFFQGYFDNNFHGKQLQSSITSGARMDGLLNIKPSDFFAIILPTPTNKVEQQKIADCLTSLDDLITAVADKIKALREHKKGLMQQLFPAEGKTTPALRFPEFKDSGEWEKKVLSDVCKLVRGPFGGALKKEIFVDDGYAVYEQSHSIYANFETYRYFINEDKYKELIRFAVRTKDIIMSCSGTMGKFSIIPENHKEGVINQALLKLTVKKGNDHRFIKFLVELPTNQEQLLSESAGGAIKNVASVSQIKEMALCIPQLEEQQKIADCLSSIDEQISAESQKLETLKTHKKGLMQQLFPTI